MINSQIIRCGWAQGDELYEAYHDQEWGVPCFEDRTLFEFLLLEGAQAGLSWITVLRKRENYGAAMAGFDPIKIARFSAAKKAKLMADSGIIRNRLKIDSAVSNAKAYLAVLEKHDSFASYIWNFVEHRPIQNCFKTLADVPASTGLSDLMAKTLKKDGFKFVGSTICYAYMQATGMVNDHLADCHRHEVCRQLGL